MPKIHSTGKPKMALAHGHKEGFGPMFNARHPKKCPPLTKKTVLDADNIQNGRAEQVLTDTDSASNDT